MSAYKRIHAAMRSRERWVLSAIRKALKSGKRWQPMNGLTALATYNAIDRLEERGRIRWVRSRMWSRSGYEEVA